MLRYILDSLKVRLTVEQAEAKHMVSDSRLGANPVPFGFQNERWRALLSKMQDGDELWEYGHFAGSLSAEDGIALIRNGEDIAHIVTMMS